MRGAKFSEAKKFYGDFLLKLDDEDFRAKLEQMGDDGMKTQEYDDMVDLAREFKAQLVGILFEYYGKDHRIVRAILL